MSDTAALQDETIRVTATWSENMSDEARNKHLDWLDDCAKEQSECEHVYEWDEDVEGIPFLYCIKCPNTLFPGEIKQRINKYAALKWWKKRATPLLKYAGKRGTMFDAEEWIAAIDALLTAEEQKDG